MTQMKITNYNYEYVGKKMISFQVFSLKQKMRKKLEDSGSESR